MIDEAQSLRIAATMARYCQRVIELIAIVAITCPTMPLALLLCLYLGQLLFSIELWFCLIIIITFEIVNVVVIIVIDLANYAACDR